MKLLDDNLAAVLDVDTLHSVVNANTIEVVKNAIVLLSFYALDSGSIVVEREVQHLCTRTNASEISTTSCEVRSSSSLHELSTYEEVLSLARCISILLNTYELVARLACCSTTLERNLNIARTLHDSSVTSGELSNLLQSYAFACCASHDVSINAREVKTYSRANGAIAISIARSDELITCCHVKCIWGDILNCSTCINLASSPCYSYSLSRCSIC